MGSADDGAPLLIRDFLGGENLSSMFVTNGNDTHASKLIKAMQGWDNEFYTTPPTGVFGSTATIKCNGATIKSEELDVCFSVPFDDDLETNECEVEIYNLSKDTETKLVKGKKITITAGFKGDTGTIFTGYVDKRITSYDGADKKTTLKCVDHIIRKKMKEITYKKGTKASTILKDLIKKTNIPIAVFKVRKDHTYKDEVKVDGWLRENIKNYADICGISVYVSGGKIYARYIKEGTNLNFTVSEATGMIGSPTEYEEEIQGEGKSEIIKGYEIETIMQHRFNAGGIVNLESQVAKGKYRIRSGSHEFSNGEATSKIKVF